MNRTVSISKALMSALASKVMLWKVMASVAMVSWLYTLSNCKHATQNERQVFNTIPKVFGVFLIQLKLRQRLRRHCNNYSADFSLFRY